jgi:hypothetical protein
MADNSGILRNYHLTDGDLALFANSLVLAMTRDLSELAAFSITNLKIEELSDLNDEFQALPDDEIFRTDLSYAIELRDLNKNAILNTMRNISIRAKAIFGENTAKYRSMAPGNISQLTDSNLLIAARQVHSAAVTNSTALAAEGITTLYLTNFGTAIDAFEAAITGVADKKIIRDDATETKVLKGNSLYNLIVKYCDYGKTLWDGVSPSKYNDYVIYSGSSPGTLDKPSGISFNLANMKVSWDALENATSYIASISTDGGATYQEVYSGSDTFFMYQPTYFGTVSVLIKGHNSGGNGPASDPYSFAYFSILPAPEGLTISLVSSTTGLIRLNFEEVASATAYKIFRSVVALGMPAGEYTYITEQSGNEYVGNTTAGMRNWFHVKAGNATQLSAASTAVFMDMAVVPE